MHWQQPRPPADAFGESRSVLGSALPRDWEWKPIGQLFDVTAGGDFDPASSTSQRDGLHPYPVYANGLSEQGLHAFSSYATARRGSITVTARGTLGKAYFRDAPYAAIGRLLVLEPKVKMDARYFAQFINFGIRFAVESTGVPQLTAPQISRYSLPVPPMAEQHSIAEALSDVDDLLAALDRLIAKKRTIKQAAMQQLLSGKTRLRGFEGEWRATTLGQVIDSCTSGATPYRGRPEFYEGNIKWITSGELNYGPIYDTLEHISQEAVKQTSLKIHPAGTFLMAITGLEAEGTRGACGIVGADAATNQSCMAIYPGKDLATEFLFYYYEYRGKALALRYCQGTKQQSYTAKTVRLLPITLPPSTEEQLAIASILSTMDAEIVALGRRREKTRAIKQGMVQQLLTGRVRLVEPGVEGESAA